jgi:predicted metal-binding membrane protein
MVAATVFVVGGIYQLTPLKERCLLHCRSPLGLLLHYGSYRGRTRDLRAAMHHGAYCLGCCWALMLLFIAFGAMNIAAMVGLAAVVFTEKVSPRGDRLSHVFGIGCLALAAAVLIWPGIAPGLTSMPDMMG